MASREQNKKRLVLSERAVEQINGREGETATLFQQFFFNSKLRGGGFAPRHLSRSALLEKKKTKGTLCVSIKLAPLETAW